MEKQVATAEAKNKAIAAQMPTGAWGTENVRSENILIPQVYLMQGQSKAVQLEKAKVGEIIESVTGKVLGGPTKAFEFIPISTFDTFMVQREEAPGDWKFLRTEKVTPANIKHKEQPNWLSVCPDTKKQLKWTYEIKFLVLPYDNYKNTLPYVLGFRSTSLRAGKALTNHFSNCRIDNVPPASKVMKVSSNKVTKNGKTFSVYDVSEGPKTSPEEQLVAYKWFKEFQKGTTVVHEATDDVETESADTTDY